MVNIPSGPDEEASEVLGSSMDAHSPQEAHTDQPHFTIQGWVFSAQKSLHSVAWPLVLVKIVAVSVVVIVPVRVAVVVVVHVGGPSARMTPKGLSKKASCCGQKGSNAS